ncbi:hypothetical protein DPMN_121340 [Dreissena polymorpha]|uniref:Uncharacterized protein n=1 Tax=Dreissena polymorpha TaxID=45954 RepID=A0A9D4GLH2_DREPO|nr:hypothetical protein DPMN_121340 [Dreissena polymorpha]
MTTPDGNVSPDLTSEDFDAYPVLSVKPYAEPERIGNLWINTDMGKAVLEDSDDDGIFEPADRETPSARKRKLVVVNMPSRNFNICESQTKHRRESPTSRIYDVSEYSPDSNESSIEINMDSRPQFVDDKGDMTWLE